MTDPKTLAEQVVRTWLDEWRGNSVHGPVTDEEWKQALVDARMESEMQVALAAIEARDKEWRERLTRFCDEGEQAARRVGEKWLALGFSLIRRELTTDTHAPKPLTP